MIRRHSYDSFNHSGAYFRERPLDAKFNPITPEQLLEAIRELERKTGEKTSFERDERPGRPA